MKIFSLSTIPHYLEDVIFGWWELRFIFIYYFHFHHEFLLDSDWGNIFTSCQPWPKFMTYRNLILEIQKENRHLKQVIFHFWVSTCKICNKPPPLVVIIVERPLIDNQRDKIVNQLYYVSGKVINNKPTWRGKYKKSYIYEV